MPLTKSWHESFYTRNGFSQLVKPISEHFHCLVKRFESLITLLVPFLDILVFLRQVLEWCRNFWNFLMNLVSVLGFEGLFSTSHFPCVSAESVISYNKSQKLHLFFRNSQFFGDTYNFWCLRRGIINSIWRRFDCPSSAKVSKSSLCLTRTSSWQSQKMPFISYWKVAGELKHSISIAKYPNLPWFALKPVLSIYSVVPESDGIYS